MRVLAAVLAACVVAGCSRVAGTATSGTRHPWTLPGRLRIAMSSSPNTLNPILMTQQVEGFAAGFVLEPLIATDPDGHDVPVLAREVPTLENGGIARDGRTITYRLRPNVRWQDGAPFTSRDVAFSVAAILNPHTAVATRHGYDLIARVDTPDALTAIFHLKRPFGPAVRTFFAHSDAPVFVLPAHLLAKERSLDRVPFNAAPVGTGPYRIVRWVRGERIDFAANDAYHGGRPRIRSITLRIIADENTIVNGIRAHEIDYFTQATPRTYPQLHGVPGVDARLVPFNGYYGFLINVTHPGLTDVRVRRAIALAIDKRRLVDEVTFGTAVPATEDLPPLLWAFDPHAGSSQRNLPAARALLAAAGWTRGADGLLSRAGRRLTLDLAFRSDSLTDRQIAVVATAALREAGFDVHARGYTTALLYATPSGGGVLANGRYDLGLQAWYAGADPDDSTQLLCAERAPAGYNWSRYCAPEMDAAQAVALGHYDRPTRTAAYARIQRLLARDVPVVFLWWPRQIEAVNDDLRGFRPNGIVESWNAGEWSI